MGTALLHFHNNIMENINMNKPTIAIFLDIRKAFDTPPPINNEIQLKKLELYGDMTNLWTYLTNRTQFIKYNNKVSDNLIIKSGVPQG